MPAASSPIESFREPLLHLEDDQLVWVGIDSSGALRHGSVELGDLYPADVAAKAAELASQLDLRPSRAVLSLGATLLGQHVLRLPLAETEELNAVFDRRCQGWISAGPGQAEYVAVPHQAANPEALAAGRDWSVFCMDRRLLMTVLLELRQRGIAISRCVSERAGAWAAAAARFGGAEGACLVISREHRESCLTLLHQGQVVLSTSLAVQPGLAEETGAVALVHEVRNVAGWWRKESRGQRLQQVHLFGFEHGLVNKLIPAINAAVGAADVYSEPTLVEGQWRLPALMAARHTGLPSVQLGLHLAPAPKRVLAIGGVLALGLVGFGLVLSHTWSARRDQLLGEFSELSTLQQQVARYEIDAEAIDRAMRELNQEAAHIGAVAARRWPVEAVLQACRDCMPVNTRLVDLVLRQDEQGMHLTATGEAPGDPLATRQALSTIQARLEATQLFDGLELEPPSQVGIKEGDSSLRFEIHADLRAQAQEEVR